MCSLTISYLRSLTVSSKGKTKVVIFITEADLLKKVREGVKTKDLEPCLKSKSFQNCTLNRYYYLL